MCVHNGVSLFIKITFQQPPAATQAQHKKNYRKSVSLQDSMVAVLHSRWNQMKLQILPQIIHMCERSIDGIKFIQFRLVCQQCTASKIESNLFFFSRSQFSLFPEFIEQPSTCAPSASDRVQSIRIEIELMVCLCDCR